MMYAPDLGAQSLGELPIDPHPVLVPLMSINTCPCPTMSVHTCPPRPYLPHFSIALRQSNLPPPKNLVTIALRVTRVPPATHPPVNVFRPFLIPSPSQQTRFDFPSVQSFSFLFPHAVTVLLFGFIYLLHLLCFLFNYVMVWLLL